MLSRVDEMMGRYQDGLAKVTPPTHPQTHPVHELAHNRRAIFLVHVQPGRVKLRGRGRVRIRFRVRVIRVRVRGVCT